MKIRFKDSSISIHDSWSSFFNIEIIEELKSIESLIGDNYTPKVYDIFKVFKVSVNKLNSVIIGQDPYPQNGVATGRSFETDNNTWNYVNKSLEAILVSFYYHSTNELISYCKVLSKIDYGEWTIPPPNKLFSKLETECGSFFLNKALTCEIGNKKAHSDYWENFTKKLINYISTNNKIIWLLWGSDAQKLKKNITESKEIIETVHPAYFSYINATPNEDRLFNFAKNSGLDKIQCTTMAIFNTGFGA